MFNVMWQMLKRDLLIFKRDFFGKFIDTFLIFLTSIIVFAYFMPSEGLSFSYGPFLLIGCIASFGLFEVVGKVSLLMADIDGERNINYSLTLPITSRALFCYTAIYWSLTSFLLTLFLFPIGKLLLFERFDLSAINILKLIPIYITMNLFFGFFSLWLGAIIKSISGIASLFMRFINPIWMFGAYFYSWKALESYSPVIAKISLINPMVYIMEGMRAACLGQEGYLPYWSCLAALWIFILALSWHASKKMKKKLDCV